MAQTVALSKILTVREREKKDAQLLYHQSIENFEKTATRLYDLLKRRENAEDSYNVFLEGTASIDRIMEQTTYITAMNKQITTLQYSVQKARSTMEAKQEKLTDAHVEVKKFEKIIESRETEQKKMALKLEQASMDEISIQQFLSRKNR